MKPISELIKEGRPRTPNPARDRWSHEQIQNECADELARWLNLCGETLPMRHAWESAEIRARWAGEDARALENARRAGIVA